MVLGILNLSSGTSYAVQFCTTTPILGTTGSGPASLYPSTITVSGLTGTVTDVNVTLLDVTTTGDNNSPGQHWVEDADIMVSGPNPANNVIVMSDAGGDNDTSTGPLADVNLTFDDAAANQLPADTKLQSGTFRPVDDDNDVFPQSGFEQDVWAAPAPAPTNSVLLSTFNGTDPNGTWSLWMVDDQNQATIQINGGWCLDILVSAGPTSSSSSSSSTPTTGPTTSSTSPTTSTTMGTTSTSSTSTSTTSTSTTSTSTTTTMATSTSTSTSTSTTSPSTTTTSTTRPPTTSTSTSTTVPGPGGPICDGLTPTILGTAGNDNLVGTPGPDVIAGGPGDDSIQGLGGDDVICGGDGNDSLVGGDGNDRLFGGNGNDSLVGEAGNDTLTGGPGSDRLVGGDGNDTMDGATEPDQCFGDAGTDTAVNCEFVIGVP